ncbi:natural killer cells antigen CD94-like isoform X2 [Odontesthes bonariensis]|uniref:natural killer cells antigen CD94-like isoform X2 n=1 Tax=Odontesthes bonariensis TaxID=219752 RepID=UPI003F580826
MAVYITMVTNKQEANLSAENQQLMEVLKNQTEQLTADNRVLKNQTDQLTADNRVLKNQTEQLTADNRVLQNRTDLMTVEIGNLENQTKHLNRQKDDLNWTLGVILTFDSFPVKEFCPDKKCQPCQGGWILYQKKCYLFYDKPAPWLTWTQSQTYCKNCGADLVVIDNQQEQEFISKNIKSYYSDHGYWIGLKESNGNFIWIDGRTDTLQYWLETGGSHPYVLVIPDKSPTQSWKRGSPEFQLQLICESEALIRLN